MLSQEYTILIYSLIFIFGILIGSFLNVLILRIPKGEEWVKTPSHCPKCNHKLAFYDNIPLFSWLFLRGKCRYCKEPISIQYPLIELTNGLLWLTSFICLGISPHTLLISAMLSGLLVLSVIDWRTYEIHNYFHIYFIALAIINILLDYRQITNSLLGGLVVSIPLLILYIASKGRAIGGGDVKLMFSCGLILGWAPIIVGFVIGCIVGSIIHIARMKISGEGRVLAMGPYLSIGIFVASLFGTPILTWYFSLFL